jgi:hypothetical protein
MVQSLRAVTAMSDPGVLADCSSPQCRALTVVIVGDPPRTTVSSTAKIAAIKLRHASEEKCFHEDAGIIESFPEGHRFLRQLGANFEIAAHNMVGEVALHGREELWCRSHPLTERMGPTKDGSDFRGGVTSPRDIGSAEWASNSNSRASRSGDASRVSSYCKPP